MLFFTCYCCLYFVCMLFIFIKSKTANNSLQELVYYMIASASYMYVKQKTLIIIKSAHFRHEAPLPSSCAALERHLASNESSAVLSAAWLSVLCLHMDVYLQNMLCEKVFLVCIIHVCVHWTMWWSNIERKTRELCKGESAYAHAACLTEARSLAK